MDELQSMWNEACVKCIIPLEHAVMINGITWNYLLPNPSQNSGRHSTFGNLLEQVLCNTWVLTDIQVVLLECWKITPYNGADRASLLWSVLHLVRCFALIHSLGKYHFICACLLFLVYFTSQILIPSTCISQHQIALGYQQEQCLLKCLDVFLKCIWLWAILFRLCAPDNVINNDGRDFAISDRTSNVKYAIVIGQFSSHLGISREPFERYHPISKSDSQLSLAIEYQGNLMSLPETLCLLMAKHHIIRQTQIAKFMGPAWGPPGSCRPQMDAMLASWTLL